MSLVFHGQFQLNSADLWRFGLVLSEASVQQTSCTQGLLKVLASVFFPFVSFFKCASTQAEALEELSRTHVDVKAKYLTISQRGAVCTDPVQDSSSGFPADLLFNAAPQADKQHTSIIFFSRFIFTHSHHTHTHTH